MAPDKESIITEQVDNRLNDLFGDDEGQGGGGDQDAGANDADEGNVSREADARLDNRLDDFFEKDKNADKKPTVDPQKIENSPIKDLKSVILSLEWEITDSVMQKLGEEIQILEKKSRDNKIVVAFLQLMGSLGKYIRKKRAEAHPDSIRLLNSVYENLELAMLSDELTDAEKKKMLVSQVGMYKQLKEDIKAGPKKPPRKASEADAEVGEAVPPPRKKPDADMQRVEERPVVTDTEAVAPALPAASGDSAAAVLEAMQQIRNTLVQEFADLKQEIRLLRESLK